MSDNPLSPIADRLARANADHLRATQAIIAAAKSAWEIYSQDVEPMQQQIVETLERHSPQLADAGRALLAVKDLLDMVALEQAVVAGHLREGQDDLRAALIKSTTLSLGIKTLYNDPDTMTEALTAITEPTLDTVMSRLSHNDRLKLAQAIDRRSNAELGNA